ncbi:MAG: glutamine amidotransferase [Bacteroidetes bacterium QS_9_68_14]|nr:MAG: glutamine amidotransferase [Bacteroidetes bacterium QS_9_68_14]
MPAPDTDAPRNGPDDALAEVRVALVQARDTAEMEAQEQTCFAERCRLHPEQLRCANLAREPLPDAFLEGADALMIGGAGAYSAMDDPDWMPGLLALMREAAERGLPTFGSCWGHQVLARAFGGTLVHDSARAELGCCPIRLTEAGQRDPLFADCPARFEANAGHHDRVTRLPPGAVELAFNDSQRFQAFRMEDAPVYGTQFHSELSAERERERLIAYRDHYRADLPDPEDFQAVLAGLVDTGAADALLHQFLCRFVVAA